MTAEYQTHGSVAVITGTRGGFLMPEVTGGNGMYVAIWKRNRDAAETKAVDGASDAAK